MTRLGVRPGVVAQRNAARSTRAYPQGPERRFGLFMRGSNGTVGTSAAPAGATDISGRLMRNDVIVTPVTSEFCHGSTSDAVDVG